MSDGRFRYNQRYEGEWWSLPRGKADLVSGLTPRYECNTIPPGSVLIDCIEDGMKPDWYFTPDGRFFYVTKKSPGYLEMRDYSRFRMILWELGFPSFDVYEEGIEFWPNVLLEQNSLSVNAMYKNRPVMLPFDSLLLASGYHITHHAYVTAGRGRAAGWLMMRIPEKKIPECPFKVGDWVSSNILDIPHTSYRVEEVNYTDGRWMWKQTSTNCWSPCDVYKLVAHDVKPEPEKREIWSKAAAEPKKHEEW